jgi:hypothetical protein
MIIVEEDRWTGLTTECEGEVGSLEPVHLDAPSPEPALKRWFQRVWKIKFRVTGEDKNVVSEGGKVGWIM